MADQRRARVPRSDSIAMAPRAHRESTSRKAAARVPAQRLGSSQDVQTESGTEPAFWGHYVEDRMRHFAQESR